MSHVTCKPDWLAVDWGTTRLRVWLMRDDGSVIERRDSDKGMGRLEKDDFAPALTELVADALPARGTLPTIMCGMVGSRQGWAEAPYATAPCEAPGLEDATCFQSGALNVFILPGVKQTAPADVMRGEETQISGLVANEPAFDGALCLPGTHSKWARISERKIVSFRTFMTGEMFALLSEKSVLRHSVGDGWDQSSFEEALGEAISHSSDLAAHLFTLRAESLLANLPPASARARLSGLLIGAELAAAKPYWGGREVVIIGATSLASAYESALLSLGANVRCAAAEGMTLAGLKTAYKNVKVATK